MNCGCGGDGERSLRMRRVGATDRQSEGSGPGGDRPSGVGRRVMSGRSQADDASVLATGRLRRHRRL